jgi:hypothetical protein
MLLLANSVAIFDLHTRFAHLKSSAPLLAALSTADGHPTRALRCIWRALCESISTYTTTSLSTCFVRVYTLINTVNRAVTTIPLDKVNNHFSDRIIIYIMSRTLHRRRSYVCLTSSHTHNTETNESARVRDFLASS